MSNNKQTPEEENEVIYQIAKQIIAIPDNLPEHAADHKLHQTFEIVKNAMRMQERATIRATAAERDELRAENKELLLKLAGVNTALNHQNDLIEKSDYSYGRLKEINGLMEIELNHKRTLLASAESALEERDKKISRLESLNAELTGVLSSWPLGRPVR